jgi:hypothetical protein
MQDRLGDACREIGPVLAGDQGEHEIERCRAAGARKPVAVDLEQAPGHLDVRKGLRETGDVFPVDRAGIAVEHARFGQNMGARAHRSEVMAPPRHLAQPSHEALVAMMVNVQPAAQDDGRMLVNRIEIAVHHRQYPVRCGNGPRIERMHRPRIELPFGEPVGDAKGFDGGSHRHHGEFRHHDEREMVRQDLRLESEHEDAMSFR